jgi:hypothetical protein
MVVGAQDALNSREQGGELIAGRGRIPRPPSEVVPRGQGGGVLRA